tara:strand:- start:2655 stop:2942 length:288 start_codon:yes stop_codon:yes gene_type:complete
MLVVFFALGAIRNGLTIVVTGLLMEISSEDRWPASSGYFNAMTAPAFTLPLLGSVAYAIAGPTSVCPSGPGGSGAVYHFMPCAAAMILYRCAVPE